MNEKLEHFTRIIQDKIEYYFPKRIVKFHVDDKPFITGKIKNLLNEIGHSATLTKNIIDDYVIRSQMKSGRRKESSIIGK